jgi:uncharacterized protein DUF955
MTEYQPADLLARLERAAHALGCHVLYCNRLAPQRAVLYRDWPPLIIVASRLPTLERCRSLAHELAHLVGGHCSRDDAARIETAAEVAAALTLWFNVDAVAERYVASHGGRISEHAGEAKAISAKLTTVLCSI